MRGALLSATPPPHMHTNMNTHMHAQAITPLLLLLPVSALLPV